MGRGLSPPSYRACSAHKQNGRIFSSARDWLPKYECYMLFSGAMSMLANLMESPLALPFTVT
jgi:hypothetical protein